MPHISLGNDAPGILSLFQYRPETARPLCDLADALLVAPSSLTRGERELIASYVSTLNDCEFCASSHAAFAAAQLPEGMTLVDQVRADAAGAPVSAKLSALLRIAAAVQRSGKDVREADVAAAREAGATDVEIHDTVLIAAAFCLFNRYVDGLATILPDDPAGYAAMAGLIVTNGYGAASGQPV
ncbi:MAG TPA: peroxidase-related enzyme [Streptosporangiaceae bacterium]|nr:peroxidase-related enzyme [Streptosporangiaceae bacterium]